MKTNLLLPGEGKNVSYELTDTELIITMSTPIKREVGKYLTQHCERILPHTNKNGVEVYYLRTKKCYKFGEFSSIIDCYYDIKRSHTVMYDELKLKHEDKIKDILFYSIL